MWKKQEFYNYHLWFNFPLCITTLDKDEDIKDQDNLWPDLSEYKNIDKKQLSKRKLHGLKDTLYLAQ